MFTETLQKIEPAKKITPRLPTPNIHTLTRVRIPKPGKPKTQLETYRPINLLSTLSKLAEKIILTRLKEEIT